MQVTVSSGRAELGLAAEWEQAAPAPSLSPTSAGTLPSSQALPAPKRRFCPPVAKTGASPKLIPQVPPALRWAPAASAPWDLDAQGGAGCAPPACASSLRWMGTVTPLPCEGQVEWDDSPTSRGLPGLGTVLLWLSIGKGPLSQGEPMSGRDPCISDPRLASPRVWLCAPVLSVHLQASVQSRWAPSGPPEVTGGGLMGPCAEPGAGVPAPALGGLCPQAAPQGMSPPVAPSQHQLLSRTLDGETEAGEVSRWLGGVLAAEWRAPLGDISPSLATCMLASAPPRAAPPALASTFIEHLLHAGPVLGMGDTAGPRKTGG